MSEEGRTTGVVAAVGETPGRFVVRLINGFALCESLSCEPVRVKDRVYGQLRRRGESWAKNLTTGQQLRLVVRSHRATYREAACQLEAGD